MQVVSGDNGDSDPSEFRFYSSAKKRGRFHDPGDFAENGDYISESEAQIPRAEPVEVFKFRKSRKDLTQRIPVTSTFLFERDKWATGS